ncbi:MAG: hypothetical protein NT013_11285 [Planctomycetia bacterium]|nr:hypothetical protein [Planctomycetia bacterium]
MSVRPQVYVGWHSCRAEEGKHALLLPLVTHIEGTIMRMTSWFESVRRQFGSATGAKSRQHGSGGTRRQTPAFVESLEDRCLLTAGDLDPTFGNGGKVTTAFSGDAQGNCMVVQSDGKIVVAGSLFSNGSNFDFALARYNADGSLDTSFDGDGKVTTDFFTFDDHANSVTMQPDGKIVVAGYTTDGGNFDFAVARYNTDGSLDTTFSDDGTVTTDFANRADYAKSVALQEDGKIIVAGIANNGSDDDFALARYNTDGSLDMSFAGDGTLVTDFASTDDRAASLVVQSDGKIVVVGNTNGFGSTDFAVARLNSDGSIDTSFDGDGKLTTRFSLFGDQAMSVALQEDGKVVVAGFSGFGTTTPFASFQVGTLFALARYNTDGSLDSSFDDNGKVTTQFGNVDELPLNPSTIQSFDYATSLAVQADGKIVASGYTIKNSGTDFAVTRFNSDGSLDRSFSGDGKLTTAFGRTGDDQANAIALQPDGKIVVAGLRDNEGTVEFALARYNSDIVVTTLPTAGGNVTALIVDGALHIRRSLTSPDLIAPVALAAVSTIQFEGSNRTDRLTLDGSLNGFAGTITFNGNAGNDTLVASTILRSVTFSGGVGNDTFLGGNGNDFADGGSGNDSLSGGNGDDSLGGGDGNDKLSGDTGDDSITGGAGADSISGGTGDDLLLGCTGRDTIDGGTGNDVLDGGDDNDVLKGSDGDDAIRGGNGNDTLSGGNGNDILTGSAGNDSLKGDAGTDTLLGDAGNDTLDGGLGTDIINGVSTGTSKDTITDTTKVIDTSFAFDFDALLAELL